MISTFSKKVARRYIWTKRKEAFITVISLFAVGGVCVGVAVLNIVMAVMAGFESDLRDKIIGNESHVLIQDRAGRLSQWREISAKLEKCDGVLAVSPVISHQVIIRARGRTNGITLIGVASGSPLEDQVRRESDQKDLFRPEGLEGGRGGGEDTGASIEEQLQHNVVEVPGIIIGGGLSRSIYAAPGDRVSVVSPEYKPGSQNLTPKIGQFLITGTFSTQVREKESAFAYIDLEAAKKYFGMGDAVTGLDIRLREIDDAPEISEKFMAMLAPTYEGIEISDWTTRNKPLREAMSLLSKVYFLVLLLITVMASFSIVTTLIMVIVEKHRDIAVLKTLGATTRDISAIFRVQGAVIGIFGTVLGTAAGYLGCVALQLYQFPLDDRIFGMTSLPIQKDLTTFVIVAISAFAICTIATLYPSRRASLTNPAEALRSD